MSLHKLLLAALCALTSVVCQADDVLDRAELLVGKVGLNHFYVVLDEETFAAIRDSDFVRTQLAAVDAGLPNFIAPQADSQRMYVRGKTTYMEFLGPGNPFSEPIGKVGIALGVDELPLLEAVQAAWSTRLNAKAERYQVEWKKATPPVPWYDVIQHPSTSNNPDVVLWASAYRPEFLPWLYPQRSARETRGSRADFLAPRFRSDRLLQDVTELSIAVPAQLKEQLARQLEVAGFRRTVRGDDFELRNAGWTLKLVDADASRKGLLAIEVATTRDHAGEIAFGSRSTLTFKKGRAARWCFQCP